MVETRAQEIQDMYTLGIFFVKDRVEKGEVKVEYCPTLQMVADYFTKPLQGSLFNKLRDVIMGYKSISTLQ